MSTYSGADRRTIPFALVPFHRSRLVKWLRDGLEGVCVLIFQDGKPEKK